MDVLKRKLIVSLLFAIFLALCIGRERAGRKVLVIPGDIYIGGLFPVHGAPQERDPYSRTCGTVRENTGVLAVEVFLATLDSINRDPVLLPSLSLGAVVRDSCFYLPGAMEGALEFIQDRINFAESTNDANSPSCGSAPEVAGVLGPFTDHFTQAVQGLLRVFAVPQVGLSHRGRHRAEEPFLVRVPPSVGSHAQAILDLMFAYNWTYISVVYSEDVTGYTLYSQFEGLAKAAGVCLATVARVSREHSPEEDFQYERIVEQLMRRRMARAVVCLCDPHTIRRLLGAIVRNNRERHLVIIGSSDWTRRPDVLRGLESAAVGGLSVVQSPTGQYSEYLTEHFRSLRPGSNLRNPWFTELWEKKFACNQAMDGLNSSCSGNETLENVDISVDLENVATGVYAMALSLDALVRDVCPDGCPDKGPIHRGELLIQYLRNITFQRDGRFFDFGSSRDGPARYDIMNYQRSVDPLGLPRYGDRKVGSWLDGELSVMYGMVQWPTGGEAPIDEVPESICSRPCAPGHLKVTSSGSHCCWLCLACPNLNCTGK